MTVAYAKLFEPIRLGSLQLPNRIVMTSMHTRIEQEPDAARRLGAFYRERVEGGVGLIITGGYAPSEAGCIEEGSACLKDESSLPLHRAVVDAVHAAQGLICMQILHAGRYGRHAKLVAPSALASPNFKRMPHALTDVQVEAVIAEFAHCAALAQRAGYDAIELMGSEGYLLNQFTCLRTNQRQDRWGGSLANRLRFVQQIVRSVRAAVGRDFPLIFRVSVRDLVEGGLLAHEVQQQVELLRDEGIDAFTTGVGWHEARIPTIAYQVPRGGWASAARTLKSYAGVPVIATNRINTPEVAESLLARGDADLVGLARPLLADSQFASKARAGHAGRINTCIACNQSCIDFVFRDKVASCLVNPRAAYETIYPIGQSSARPKRVAVVGGGAAGLSCAVTAAQRGHEVTLFESEARIGGQLNLASQVPGKEFAQTLRYYIEMLKLHGVRTLLRTRADAATLLAQGFEEIVVATGVRARAPLLPGIDHSKVLSYADVLSGAVEVGHKVAIIGAGGIGHDVAVFLSRPACGPDDPIQAYYETWGIEAGTGVRPGGREIHVFQRSQTPMGTTLGLSTRWIIKAELQQHGVRFHAGLRYVEIDDVGLRYETVSGVRQLAVDHVVVCAGQESRRDLYDELVSLGVRCHLIGGAQEAAELDAARAIDQGMKVAYAL